MTPTDSSPRLSVVLCTHNPHQNRLCRTLAALQRQSLPTASWELLIVDNGSSQRLETFALHAHAPAGFRLIYEPKLGLTAARLAGFRAAKAGFLLLVDDDNLLVPDYLEHALHVFESHPRLGAAGGPCRPEFERPPPGWTQEFLPLLALRDLGPKALIENLHRAEAGTHWLYPEAAPIGAGMVLRRAAIETWMAQAGTTSLSDRRGKALSSGGDNDIVLHVLHAGWSVGYFPELGITHLIPASRLEPAYLARLNYGIQKSWVQVLDRHQANPWSPINRWTLAFRCARAWFRHHAWRSPAARVRWHGACGHFAGRAALS